MRNYGLVMFLLFISCYPPVNTIAQQRSRASASGDSVIANPGALKMSCGVDVLLNELRKNPAFLTIEKNTNAEIIKKVSMGFTDTVILPVVFHIINTNPAAITDLQIADAVRDLNNAFSKTNNYAGSQGADTKIRFALAQKDPNGGNTSGIDRVASYYSDNMNMYTEDGLLKSLQIWNPVKYINIWVVSSIIGEIGASFGCGVWTRMNAGGYATMPTAGGVGSLTDGIVVTGFGPMLAHEMGHYLGLYHTFEGGCTNNNCLTDGDRVCDTPPDGSTLSSPSCSSPTNSCNTDTLSNHSNGFFPRDTTDQIANFMDYGNTSCSNQFTQGQADRMQATLLTLRTGLLPDVLTKPCNTNAIASFTRNIDHPKVGDPIVFTNTSTNSTFFRWLVNDVSVATGAITTRTLTPTIVGKTKVTLYAYSADLSCYASFSDFVFVDCGVAARFYNNKRSIASKTNIYLDTVLFTNNSYGSNLAYTWIRTNNSAFGRNIVTSNAAGGGANDLSYVFQDPGVYFVKLIATNTVSGCVDSTVQQTQIGVSDPTADATLYMFSANCYQDTKIRIQFYVCNNGYATMPVNTPISFYDADPRLGSANKVGSSFLMPDSLTGFCCGKVYTQIVDIGYRGLNQLYAVVNDQGNATPFHLPNATLVEKDYTNNYSFLTNMRFKVAVTPGISTLEPGDTLQLAAQGTPDPLSYLWSPATKLSCTGCRTPFLYADTGTTKRVIATSQYQCYDTAYVTILVPPADDYTVTINNISCVPQQDSLSVNFTIRNLFKRGIIPKSLAVSFYKDDPSTGSAVLLRNVFIVTDSVLAKQQTYNCKVKKITGQSLLYASVNDNGTNIPIQTASAALPEKVYTNNVSSLLYQPLNNTIDTAICTGDKFLGYNTTGTFIDNYVTKGGCDSQRIIHLTIRTVAVVNTTLNITICDGQKFAGYTTTGTYVDVYRGVNSCDSIRTLNLTVNPVVNKTYNVQICKGDTYTAAGKQQSQTGKYVDTTQSYLGCDSITTTYLIVNALPTDFLPADTMMCLDKTLILSLSKYTTIAWNTGSVSPSFTVTAPGTYSAKVIDRNGCAGEDSINVLFQKCIPIQIPTAFTPNHDGRNDVFRPVIPVLLKNYKMQIFSRWGVLLFETTQYTNGWNGTYKGEVQSNGVYVYFITFVDDDGFAVAKKGTFVLLK